MLLNGFWILPRPNRIRNVRLVFGVNSKGETDRSMTLWSGAADCAVSFSTEKCRISWRTPFSRTRKSFFVRSRTGWSSLSVTRTYTGTRVTCTRMVPGGPGFCWEREIVESDHIIIIRGKERIISLALLCLNLSPPFISVERRNSYLIIDASRDCCDQKILLQITCFHTPCNELFSRNGFYHADLMP